MEANKITQNVNKSIFFPFLVPTLRQAYKCSHSSSTSNSRGNSTTIGGGAHTPFEVLVLLFCTIGVYWSCLLFVVRLSIEATVNLTPVLCFHKSHVHFSKQYLDPDPHCLLQSRCLSRFLVHFPIFLDGSLVPIVQYIDSNRNRTLRQRVHKKFIVIIIIERNLFESNKQETIHHRCLD